MKYLILVLLLLSPPAFAQEAPNPDRIKFNQIKAAAMAQCHIPAAMPTYTESVLNRFLAQTFWPELKMLNTAFLMGFSALSSANITRGSCVVVFLGLPNDPTWERASNFFGRAQMAGALPELIFDGFDENSQVLLKPLGEPVN